MKHLGLIWIFVLLIMLPVISTAAPVWDWLTLSPTEIEAVLRFDGTYRRTKDADNTIDTQWEAGVRIRQRGYILDPGIAEFHLGLEPVYIWGLFDLSDDPTKLTGNNLSYFFDLEMLRGTPGPFAYLVNATRTTNVNSGSLGGRYETEAENKSASIRWKSLAFPMSLTYTDLLLKQDFLSGKGDTTTQRDEHVKTLTVKGQSSKTRLLAEHRDVDNNVPGRDLDYKLDRVNLIHNLPWGRGSTLNSRFNFNDRKGFNANRRIDLDERANIQHTDNIFSLTRYNFSTVTQTYRTTVNSGAFNLSHRLYQNLVTTASLWGSSQRSDLMDLTRLRAGISSNYSKNIFGVGVSAGLGYSYQLTDRDSRRGLVEVIDESHVVPLDGAVILNRRFVVIATIIVTNADGSLVYDDGIDYTIFDIPDDLTQLQTIPGGRIETGDTILVSYKAIALPSQEFSTTNTNYRLGFALGWMKFSHSYTNLDENLISGQGESFLNPRLDVRTHLEFKWNIANVEFQVGANRVFHRREEFENTIYTFRENLGWNAFKNTLWNLNAVQSFTRSTTLETDLYSLELTADWQPLTNLSIRPKLGTWKRFDEGIATGSGKRDDLYINAGFTLRWRYRKVLFNMAYNHNQRVVDTQFIGESETIEDRLMFNLTRRF